MKVMLLTAVKLCAAELCVYLISMYCCSLGGSIYAILSTESKLLSEVGLFTCEMPPRQGNASLDRPKCDKPFNAQGIISCLAECFRFSVSFSPLPFPVYILYRNVNGPVVMAAIPHVYILN